MPGEKKLVRRFLRPNSSKTRGAQMVPNREKRLYKEKTGYNNTI
jgi:hypothetical protein